MGDLATAPVTAPVQLPKSMTNVVATNGGTYDAGTGVVTYPASQAALVAAYQGVLSSVVSYRAPAAGTVVTATSSMSTATSEGLNPNTNTASTSVTMVAPLPVSPTAFAALPLALPPTLPAGTYLVLVQGNGLRLMQRLARQ